MGTKILVAGGTGTIGIQLVKLLIERGDDVFVVGMHDKDYAIKLLPPGTKYTQTDLTSFENCCNVTKGVTEVYNLVGIKGSVGIGQKKTASFFYPMINFQTNLMESAFRNGVTHYLFVSSICAYPQSSGPKDERSCWDGMPVQNDRIPGLVKRIGEIQGETYLHEYGWDAVKIVRPSNVYGPHDDFNPVSAQVIPSLISKALSSNGEINVWGDGSVIRDFIYSEDVAYWMIKAMEKAPTCQAINIGSGEPVTIKKLADTIVDLVLEKTGKKITINWDINGPAGDPVRILDTKLAKDVLGFEQLTDLKEGLSKTIDWYMVNKN